MEREKLKKIRRQKALAFAEDLKKGLSLQDIGNKYGYTREYIRQLLLNELGIKSNPKDYKFYDGGIKDVVVKELITEEFNAKLRKLKQELDKTKERFYQMRLYYKKKYGKQNEVRF